MSFDFNHKLWVATKKDIDRLIQRQNILKKLSPLSDPIMTYKLFSEMYILYAELANKLATVYLKTFQVQKKRIVRALVEAANRRLLELKNELKSLELSEYIYTDKALIAKKLTPYDLVIWRSPAFLFRRPPDIQNIFYEKMIFSDEATEKENIQKEKAITKAAVILIQAHERARQARVYRAAIKFNIKYLKTPPKPKITYKFNHYPDQPMSIPVKKTVFNPNYVKQTASCMKIGEEENVIKTPTDPYMDPIFTKAANIIQRTWRAYKNRKILKAKYIFKETLYGSVKKRRPKRLNSFRDAVVQTYKDQIVKDKLEEDYIKLMTDERTRFLQQRSPWIMEDISDHIRAWFREFYDKLGVFHTYPDAIKQGTVLVLIDETYTPEEYKDKINEQNMSKEEKKKLAEKARAQKKKEKDKIRKEKIKEAKRRKKMKDAGIIDIAYDITSNKNIELIEKTIQQYSIDWKLVDEYLNKNEIIKDWVSESELAIIHKELRALVDEFMRVEYELLQRALCMDLKKKYKAPKQKKEKNKKGKKGKKVKDMTADRSLESLYKELQDAGIIEKISHVAFDEYISEFNFIADDTRDEDNLTTLAPSKGDIKMAIQECMIGMGEFEVDKPKSLCIVGPLKSGKKLLCKIIASELDAVFMNISPEKTVNYANDLNYFLHLIIKVAKAFQPTILFIEDVHRVFWKKVPKEQADISPRLLEKSIAKKILKPLKKTDKVMLLGTSDMPWTAKPGLKKNFQKILLIPQSDYGSSFLLWLEHISQNGGETVLPDSDISTLARMLQKYTSGDIAENMETTLSINRRMKLEKWPLNPQEFMDEFLDRQEPYFPPDDKMFAKFTKWFTGANKMAKLRRAFLKKKAEKNKKKK